MDVDRAVSAFEYYQWLAQTREYVERHLDHPISLAEVAAHVGKERTYYSRIFRRRVGVTFQHWLRITRIETAKTMLRSADHRIGDVARAVGMSDRRAFTRAFKRETGMTPSVYRLRSAPHGRRSGPPAAPR